MTTTKARKTVRKSTKKNRASGIPDAARTDRLRKAVLKEIGQRIVTTKILARVKPKTADGGQREPSLPRNNGSAQVSTSPGDARRSTSPRAHSEQGDPSKAKPPAPKAPDPSKNGKDAKPSKATPPKPSSPAKQAGAPSAKAMRRRSALDAAAQVLAAAKKPMRANDLIDAMAAQNLWKSHHGKTPSATLSAAIAREIAAKGKNTRFKKVDRGLFAAGPGVKQA